MADPDYIEIIAMEELTPGSRIQLDVDGKPIVIYRVGENLFALEDICTHDQGAIGEGRLDGNQIICPRHGARFDIETGKALNAPAFTDIRTYAIRNHNGMIEIKI